jgi:DNA-directed RNA polymerase specialized sigma24 family protein
MAEGVYRNLLGVARRHARRADEAEDVLQDALLAAVAAGRDVGDSGTQRWLMGVIRNQATLAARGAARRRRRETRWAHEREGDVPAEPLPVADVLSGLPPSLKAVAALALTGHSKREIAFLLDLPDTALRQRLTGLRRALAARGIAMPATTPGLNLDLQYGRIRDALLPLLIAQKGTIASHDPDGHLFVVRRAHKARAGGN